MNVFTRDLGFCQGRIAKAGAPDGEFVYELGHSREIDALVNVGDYHQVEQTFQVSGGSQFIRPTIYVHLSESPTSGFWEVSAWLNGQKVVARRVLPTRRPLYLEDWRICLATAAPPPDTNVLAFRLELV